MLNKYNKILLFDVETSGLDFKKDKIIEFGYIVIENNKEIDSGYIFINWFLHDKNFKLSDKIQELTHITPDMLKNEGVSSKEAFNKIYDLLNQSDLIICHNQQFDMNMIFQFLYNNHTFTKSEDAFNWLNRVDYLDTLLIVGDSKPWSYESRHTLTDACKYFKVDLTNAHRAIDDIRGTWLLLKAMYNKGIDVDSYINKWGYYEKHYTNKDLPKKPKKVTFKPISFN